MIKFALLCDGTSDFCLSDVVDWLMQQHFPDRAYRVVPARELVPAREDLPTRLKKTVALYEPTVILCHRDAETASLAQRTAEVKSASVQVPVPTIPVVPVRMIEAWLLFDEVAIRSAADNRNGQVQLNLPTPLKAEALADPKSALLAALLNACELNARRRKSFHEHRARSRISGYIDDFSPLRQLTAFRQFEQQFTGTVIAI